jgi:hypothetical protein
MRNLGIALMIVLIALGLLASDSVSSDVNVNKNLEESTYDIPKYKSDIVRQQKKLSELEKHEVFDIIHNHYFSKLTSEHQEFFNKHKGYKILSFESAALLAPKNRDFAFIVYDSMDKRIKILIYDGSHQRFKQLYKDIKIIDGLSESNCGFWRFGSNDYIIGEELYYLRGLLKKKPLQFVKDIDILKCRIISEDDWFVLERGCFESGYDKDNVNTFTSLCLATDYVYNNWDCLRYDKKQNLFILFYGQAFAD